MNSVYPSNKSLKKISKRNINVSMTLPTWPINFVKFPVSESPGSVEIFLVLKLPKNLYMEWRVGTMGSILIEKSGFLNEKICSWYSTKNRELDKIPYKINQRGFSSSEWNLKTQNLSSLVSQLKIRQTWHLDIKKNSLTSPPNLNQPFIKSHMDFRTTNHCPRLSVHVHMAHSVS